MCIAEDTSFDEEFKIVKQQRDPISSAIRAAQASADAFMDVSAAKLAMWGELVRALGTANECIHRDEYPRVTAHIDILLKQADGLRERRT